MLFHFYGVVDIKILTHKLPMVPLYVCQLFGDDS